MGYYYFVIVLHLVSQRFEDTKGVTRSKI